MQCCCCIISFYLCFPTCSLSPFLQFFLLGRSIDSLGQENVIFLQRDFNLKVAWHFMSFLYLKKHPILLIISFLTDHYLSAPSGLVLYITDSLAPILIVVFVTCLLSGQLKSKIWVKKINYKSEVKAPKKYLNTKPQSKFWLTIQCE